MKRRNNKYTPAALGGSWIRPTSRLAIYLRDDFRCVYCEASLTDGAKLQLDHYVRVQDGGSNACSNLLTACAFCNNSKSNSTIRQWFARLRARGVDTDPIRKRIRRSLALSMEPFREEARKARAGR